MAWVFFATIAFLTWVISFLGFSENTLLCMIFSAIMAIGLEMWSRLSRIERTLRENIDEIASQLHPIEKIESELSDIGMEVRSYIQERREPYEL